jgi:hypothetical protein
MVKAVKVGKKLVEVGKTGLPLPSKLLKKDLGLKMTDNDGDLKVLKKNKAGNLYWATHKKSSPKKRKSPKKSSPKKRKSPKKSSPKRRKSPARRASPNRRQLTQAQRLKFRRQISSNIDDDDTIRDIFMDVVNALNK